MNSLDANVVLRYILHDIPDQFRRSEVLINGSPCYVSDVIVTEVVYVLEKLMDVPRSNIALILRKFLALETINCNDQLLMEVIDLFEAKRTLSFSDCYAAVEAKRSENNLATFDKELIRHGGEHVTAP